MAISEHIHPLKKRQEAANAAARVVALHKVAAFDALVSLAEQQPVGVDPFDSTRPVPVVDFCPILSMRGGTRRFKTEEEHQKYLAEPAITQTLQLYVRKRHDPEIYSKLPVATREFLEATIGLAGDISVEFTFHTLDISFRSLGTARGHSTLSAEDIARFGLTEQVKRIIDRMRACDQLFKNVDWKELFRVGADMDRQAREREQAAHHHHGILADLVGL